MRRLGILLIAVCLSCKPAEQQPAKGPAAAGPQVRATVVTVRTTIDGKSRDHQLVIAGDRARNLSEQDAWRLFDTKANTVTFVDDIERTVRTEPLAELVKKREEVNANALPQHYPRATVARAAQKLTIAAGAYKRELTLAENPQIPRELFAMMHASETPSSPLAPMMRDVDRALQSVRGFPTRDRTTVPLGKGQLVVERALVGISQREVPESLLAIPKGYKDAGATAERLGKAAGRKD